MSYPHKVASRDPIDVGGGMFRVLAGALLGWRRSQWMSLTSLSAFAAALFAAATSFIGDGVRAALGLPHRRRAVWWRIVRTVAVSSSTSTPPAR